MKCSSCKTRVQLSWKTYWQANSEGYLCARCNRRVRARDSLTWPLISTMILLAVFIPITMLTLRFPKVICILCYLIATIGILVPIDIFIRKYLRKADPS